jgi:putative ATP-dependent endonuclease of OLD family
MKLVRLEIRNYRSIKEQADDKAIILGGLDCLVGKNNAGKSNILEAISYLLGGESLTEDLYYKRDSNLIIDVRGYFQVEDADFGRLKIENKRQSMREQVLEDGTIGICRRSNQGQIEVIGLYPKTERLRKARFEEFHGNAWDSKSDKEDFKNRMLAEYPELDEFLTSGKESNKGEWPDAYSRFIQATPDGIEFVKLPASPPTGISADLNNLLPRPVFIPAVKEVSEVTKTTKRSELGALLSDLSSEIHDELDQAIDQAMAEVYRRLNITADNETGKILDERHPGVRKIEHRITDYVSETFQDISVSLEFPNPESKVMFDNAHVWIEEEGFDRVLVDYVGEGVKRVLIFSLIRTLADLRRGQLLIGEDEVAGEDSRGMHQPLLILYEEADLFLHPGLQRILLKAFGTLEESGDQVIFTTHSPFMLQSSLLSTISLVTKDTEAGTQVTEFHKVLNEREERIRNRLLQVQNVSSYIFADRVLLVEGISDRVVLNKLAPALSPEWDFEKGGIPILPVTGKGDLPLFREFLRTLGIETFILTDIDAVEDAVVRLCSADDVRNMRDKLLAQAQNVIETGKCSPRINKKYVDRLARGYQWSQVFSGLESLYKALTKDDSPTDEQMGCLEKLLLKRETDAKSQVLGSEDPEIVECLEELVELLLEENVLLLRGTVEDYYPGGSRSNKVKSALEFDPADHSRDELCSCFAPIYGGATTDMEEFLSRLFDN